MSKGYDRHQERKAAINALGRALARRAKSSCELCEDSGTSLRPFEVPPSGDEVDFERTLMLCEPCFTALEKGRPEGARWNFLSAAVWNELAPAQVCAVRLTRILAESGQTWRPGRLEDLYLPPEVEEWLGQ